MSRPIRGTQGLKGRPQVVNGNQIKITCPTCRAAAHPTGQDGRYQCSGCAKVFSLTKM
jgi:transposase-like protein